ncbi:hypothetical protein ACS0TY_034273 [Phlomoides rotata]
MNATIATGSGTKEEEKLSAAAERFCRRFSLAEIQSATENFSETHLVGHGGFGKVYKGQIDNGKECVAIKQLAPNSNQGEREFLTEIETLSKLRHMNLVSLIGYCNQNGEMILVYEYVARGTLADHLYRNRESDDFLPLRWKQCLNICIGAGRGIDYLHTGTSIIHRDVKTTNILLDENFTAKVSDFGLAKHLSTSSTKSHVSTIIKGSFGYLDPSYFTTCRLTRKSDTYSFGVVLLEVLCGRPAVDPRLGEDERSLVMWAQEKIRKGKTDQIVASNMRDEISDNCLKTYVRIARRCLNPEPKKRPTMAQVVGQLEFALEQQDRKATSRFLPFLNWVIPYGSHATGSTQKDHKRDDVNTLPTVNMLPVAVPAIPIHDLNDITNHFSRCLIREDVGSSVYRGVLKGGQVAAIKMINDRCHYKKHFLKQVSIVSNLKHENVAQLLGYCVDGFKHFLAYEFAPNGSLHDILHGQQGVNGSKPVPALSWGQRVKIAMGAAKGLEYVHEKEQRHKNITSSSIWLFDDYQIAKIADFDWETPDDFDSVLYDDTCYYHPLMWQQLEDRRRLDKANSSCDVYSFGVVLLELLTGGKVIDDMRASGEHIVEHITLGGKVFDVRQPSGERHIVEWAKPWLTEDKVTWIVDARLGTDYPRKDAAKMAAIAALCVQYEEKSRPSMGTVVRALDPMFKASSARET